MACLLQGKGKACKNPLNKAAQQTDAQLIRHCSKRDKGVCTLKGQDSTFNQEVGEHISSLKPRSTLIFPIHHPPSLSLDPTPPHFPLTILLRVLSRTFRLIRYRHAPGMQHHPITSLRPLPIVSIGKVTHDPMPYMLCVESQLMPPPTHWLQPR